MTIEKETLIRMYWEEEKHIPLIAQLLNVSNNSVRYLFKKYDIPRRSKSEARKLLYKKYGIKPTTVVRGENATNWRGGRNKTVQGYILLVLKPEDDFFKPMCRKLPNMNSYTILEHRLVMAKSLNRYLLPTEKVHHINGDKGDNRIENLELISPSNHQLRTLFCYKCPLKKENNILRKKLQVLGQGNFLQK